MMVEMHEQLDAFKDLLSAPMDHPLSTNIGRICFLRRRSRGFKQNPNGLVKEWDIDHLQHFIVGHLQKNHKGEICLRIYQCDRNGDQDGYNNFGECTNFDDLVFVDNLN